MAVAYVHVLKSIESLVALELIYLLFVINVKLVSSEHGDGCHFSREALRIFGERYFDAFCEIKGMA